MKKLLLATMTLILTATIAYAGSLEDRTDRLSQGSGYVFSPGYINSATQRAQVVKNQGAKEQESVLEQSMVNADNRLENAVDGKAGEKIEPALQQKTGAGDRNKGNSLTDLDKQYLRCDINGDGKVNNVDLTLVRSLLFAVKGDAYYNENADIDRSGSITSSDITRVRQASLGGFATAKNKLPVVTPIITQSNDRGIISDLGLKANSDDSVISLSSVPGASNATPKTGRINPGLKDVAANQDAHIDKDRVGMIPLSGITDKAMVPLDPAESKENAKDSDMAIKLAGMMKAPGEEERVNFDRSIIGVKDVMMEDSRMLSDAAMRDFEDASRLIDTMGSMRDMFQAGEIAQITGALTNLTLKRQELYNGYVKATENIYAYLEILLGIVNSEDIIPDANLMSLDSTALAKRKAMVDLYIDSIKDKDKNNLASNEKEALNLYATALKPMKDEYSQKLSMAVRLFAQDVRYFIGEREPLMVEKDKSGIKAMLLLDKSKK